MDRLDHLAEEFPAAAGVVCRGRGAGQFGQVDLRLVLGDVPYYGQDETAGRGDHRAEADPGGERAAFPPLTGQPHPHWLEMLGYTRFSRA